MVKMPLEMNEHRAVGVLTGPVVLRDSVGTHDLQGGFWSYPQEKVEIVSHSARCILLVEKRHILDNMQQHEFAEKNGCVLASGNGYPRRAFHLFLRRLRDELALPFLVLADCDPAGFELFFLMARGVVRSGSAARERLAIPEAEFVGIRVKDRKALGLDQRYIIDLMDRERQQLSRLRRCAWLQHDAEWQREFDALANQGAKFEMEAAGWAGGPDQAYFSYFANQFLPTRLTARDNLRLVEHDR